MSAKNNEFARLDDLRAAMNAVEILSTSPANAELIREISIELGKKATEPINFENTKSEE